MSARIPVIVFAALVWAMSPASFARNLPVAKDLAADARLAQRHKAPILLMFSSADCAYCALVRQYYLEPLVNDRAYRNKVIVRVVDIDSDQRLVDFAGVRTDHTEFAERHAATFVPLLKYFGPDGQELVSELLGFSNEDFYGFYFDQKLAESIRKLQGDGQVRR